MRSSTTNLPYRGQQPPSDSNQTPDSSTQLLQNPSTPSITTTEEENIVPGTSSPTTPVPSTRHVQEWMASNAPRLLSFLHDGAALLAPYQRIFELHHEEQAIGDRMLGFSSTNPAGQRDEEMETVYQELQRRPVELCLAIVAELDPLVREEGVRERLAYFKREFEALEEGFAGRGTSTGN